MSISDKLQIRASIPRDTGAIERLYPEAFPDENLLPLVGQLLRDATSVLSLVGIVERQVVGHGIFTKCGVVGSSVKTALLGPLAVAPAAQKQGIGSAVVRAGLRQLAEADVALVYVLGDPAYYGRLGFLPELSVSPPYALPEEWEGAWQSQEINPVTPPCSGTLSVPAQWMQPALWAP